MLIFKTVVRHDGDRTKRSTAANNSDPQKSSYYSIHSTKRHKMQESGNELLHTQDRNILHLYKNITNIGMLLVDVKQNLFITMNMIYQEE